VLNGQCRHLVPRIILNRYFLAQHSLIITLTLAVLRVAEPIFSLGTDLVAPLEWACHVNKKGSICKIKGSEVRVAHFQ
jgi:hypothetical protein